MDKRSAQDDLKRCTPQPVFSDVVKRISLIGSISPQSYFTERLKSKRNIWREEIYCIISLFIIDWSAAAAVQFVLVDLARLELFEPPDLPVTTEFAVSALLIAPLTETLFIAVLRSLLASLSLGFGWLLLIVALLAFPAHRYEGTVSALTISIDFACMAYQLETLTRARGTWSAVRWVTVTHFGMNCIALARIAVFAGVA